MTKEEEKAKAVDLICKYTFAGIYFTDGQNGAERNAKFCATLECQSIIDELEYVKPMVNGHDYYQYRDRITFYKGVIKAIEQQ